jgi:SAM-dependent methyltransferase
MTWAEIDWAALKRMREIFLSSESSASSYWRTIADVASYDFTFAERIGCKWDAVIDELRLREWSPPGGCVVDWGCGSGVAGRRVLSAWPGKFDRLVVWDKSPLAREFALRRAAEDFPDVAVGDSELPLEIGLLLVSHLINELTPAARDSLLQILRRAAAVIWIEPGTHEASRKLIDVRELVRAEFSTVAPCTHNERCGMLTPANERHWCHHFAKAPSHVFMDAGWKRFADVMEIDLRSLPYSFLVMEKRANVTGDGNLSRIIGEARHYKGYSKILSCQREGVEEFVLQTRSAPALAKELRKNPGAVYEWTRDGGRILSGRRVV